MKKDEFIDAYNAGRNGTDNFYRHPMVKSFAYSDGVKECANAGCYWLLDIMATELPAEFKKYVEVPSTCVVTVVVAKHKAKITAEFEDGVVAWTRNIDITDMPEGKWLFYIADDGEDVDARYRCILLSEY